jgi:putative membrane protein
VLAHLDVGWHLQPVPVGLALLSLALFAHGFVRMRRRNAEHADRGRAALFLLAVGCGVLPLVSPLDGIADDYLLSAHMLEHVLIGDVAPALALVAVRGPLVFFLLPQPVLRAAARLRPLRATVSFLLRPAAGFTAWLAVVALWHVPAAYDYAAGHERVHDLQHACFVVAGVLVWAQLVDPARRRALTPAGRILYAWSLFVAGHLATHVLLFDDVAHYAHYAAQPDRLLGLSPVADQHWAAWTMTIEQLLAFGTLTLLLVRRIPLPGAAEPVESPRSSSAP